MATRKTGGRSSSQSKRRKLPQNEDDYDARLERVSELWGKSDRRIARILIDEGFFVPPVSRVAVDQAKFEDSCRRNVNNYRRKIRQRMRAEKRAFTAEDVAEFTADHIARLQTRIDELDERCSKAGVKDTPYVQMQSEIRQLETLIAKARGVAEPAAVGGDSGVYPKIPFLGVVVGLDQLTPAARKKIKAWNAGDREK